MQTIMSTVKNEDREIVMPKERVMVINEHNIIT
jgi:hypothetical protein